MGTVALWQGYPVAALELNRARGFGATTSFVEIFVANYGGAGRSPDGPAGAPATQARGSIFRFDTADLAAELPQPDTALLSRAQALARTGDTRTPTGPVPQPGSLQGVGWLALAESNEVEEWSLLVGPLYVQRMDPIRRSKNAAIVRVRCTLADQRLLWSYGVMPRWSYNRRRPDGTVAADSLQPDGELWSTKKILEDALSAVKGSPKLARAPKAAEAGRGPVELPPYAAGLEALGEIVKERGLEEPCLDWDGRVSIYEPGEGRVGYAPRGVGENVQDVPVDLHLDKKGTGKGLTVEAGFGPPYVLVSGGPRIASAAVDDWEPVLIQPRTGEIGYLTEDGRGEELVRSLTGDRYGLDWLKIWVLGPRSHQGVPGLSREVAELLGRDAWRLYRLPGAETFGPPVEGQPRLRTIGPNAHLLPLLERAETSTGRRLPPFVESYAFAPVHHQFDGSEEAEQLAKSNNRLDEIKADVEESARRLGKAGILGTNLQLRLSGPGSTQFAAGRIQDLLTNDTGLNLFFSFEEVYAAIDAARRIVRIASVGAGLAQAYEVELRKRYEIERRDRDVLLDLAKDVVKFEEDLTASRNSTESIEEEIEEAGQARAQAIRELARSRASQLARKREQQEVESRLRGGGAEQPKARIAVTHENLPRSPDTHAQVENGQLGIVRLSRLAGWLRSPAVPVAHATEFVPRAVRVTFGTHLRPRTDQPQGSPRTATPGGTSSLGVVLDPAGAGGGQSVIPSVLSDRESIYRALFHRLARGSPERRPIEEAEAPADADVATRSTAQRVRSSCLPIRRPDLVELIPLAGPGNVRDLDAIAHELAASAMSVRDVVEEERLTLGRPWPVQCDGVVAAVQIRSREDMKGFETIVHTGKNAPAVQLWKTQVRPRARQRGASDGAKREGLA